MSVRAAGVTVSSVPGGLGGGGRPRPLSPQRSLFALMNTTSTPLQPVAARKRWAIDGAAKLLITVGGGGGGGGAGGMNIHEEQRALVPAQRTILQNAPSCKNTHSIISSRH